MSTTLRDLVEASSLHLQTLVPGDLDRVIRWVHVTELYDASSYLTGGELILTAGVWQQRRHSAAGFVQALRDRDIAGIGYGLLEGHDQVPAAVVRACRELSVPLFAVPVRTPFVAVSQWFVERLALDREAGLRQALALNAELLAAAEVPAAVDALNGVARLLRRTVGHAVWIVDDLGRELARAGRRPDPATQRALLGADPGLDYWIAQPIKARGRTRALLAVATSAADLNARSQMAAASPFIGLILARERAVRETERRLAGEVVSLVLGRQTDAARVRMPYYRLNPDKPLAVVACVVPQRERSLALAERWLDQTGRSGVVELRGDQLLTVVDGQDLLDPAALDATARSLGSAVAATAVGLGAVAENIILLRRSLIQARQAAALGARRGGGIVVSHDRTGDHALLLALQDPDVIDAFRDSLLAPIEDHDRRNRTELVHTLRVFLVSGGRWQESAGQLHLHVNSLRNRIERIEQLTNRKLDSTSDRVDLWLALQATGL
ncbi:MAG TPA: PucR family transcriptional regulator ligand-binding domain-containing protein [Propionibacteriaceae bacterium]